MTSPPTQRLYLEDARRKTALATVTAHASGGFLLDKTVFHTPDWRYHHQQPCDRGHVIADGHKLKIHKVAWDQRARLIHRTDGPMPSIGAKAQLHLDADRRLVQARAHTLMHLLVQALSECRAQMLAQPEVVGGGEVRVDAKFREAPATAWPKVLSRTKQLVEARVDVVTQWLPRDDAARIVTPQAVPLGEIAPGEPTLRIVRIGASALPCDAPLVSHGWEVGEWRAALPQPAKEGSSRLRAKVV
ncbi:MAG: hypothetical protein WDA16_04395 [Candidatus Thermoplasmatota archaeon]